MWHDETIAVIGLGYVGLPLAVALAEHHDGKVIGYDHDPVRIEELRRNIDRGAAMPPSRLGNSGLNLTTDGAGIANAVLYIVATPTPCDAQSRPDLSLLLAACQTIGRSLRRGAAVIFECTVYPGVTEQICGPELARHSGLTAGTDFFLGYAPERANPGDGHHTLASIDKIVAGQTPQLTEQLVALYGKLTSGTVHAAPDIRTAEMAKAIENAQRDLNIAFINEIAVLCSRLGLSTRDVLALARTKWNFLDFHPGLVGGHCIGVDPYYLLACAQQVGMEARVITAGREVNEAMAEFAARGIDAAWREQVGDVAGARSAEILVLGASFKANVPDLRNSKIRELVEILQCLRHIVSVRDPVVPSDALARFTDQLPVPVAEGSGNWDIVILAVAHQCWCDEGPIPFMARLRPGGLIADLTGAWRDRIGGRAAYWTL